MNPIRKMDDPKRGAYTHNGYRASRAWVFECPDCHEIGFGNAWRTTRKKAKDALHKHRLEQHGGPGLGV